MEAFGHRGVAIHSLDGLTMTQERIRVLIEKLVNLYKLSKAGVGEE